MTTAYWGTPGDGTLGLSNVHYLPYRTTLDKGEGRAVEIGPFRRSEWMAGMELMNHVIWEGRSWPFEEPFASVDAFRGYFLSHTAMVVRAQESANSNGDGGGDGGTMLGCFYIKPNFPGRCAHVCNGGFITAPPFRRSGVGRLMGRFFLRLARDLGYRSAYFNLVFESNQPSVRLWESLGFVRVAELEEAARLKGMAGFDTAYGYRYDLTKTTE